MPKTIESNVLNVTVADPRATYLAHKDEIRAAIEGVLDRGRYILGDEVQQFECEFARYIGVRECVAVASGTDALQLALRACEIGPGDRVLTVSNTAVATVAAIHLVGATPVLADVDARTFTLDLECAENAIRHPHGQRIRAVIPVHLYGHPCAMDAMTALATRYDLRIVEDCAQAHGAAFGGRRVGSFGHLGAFSFYPTKNLGAFGDGGAVVTNDPQLATKLRLLREYGWSERYISIIPGMNTRLDELQAAILRVNLRYLEHANARRRAIASEYDEALATSAVQIPVVLPEAFHVYHQYVIRSEDRENLRIYLQRRGVGTAVLYPVPIHCQQGYRDIIETGPGGLRETERASREILCLPVHPGLTNAQVGLIKSLVAAWTPQTVR
jgi:dTDP-4-amino-4,6-dideoxygalactose transaminase